MSKAPAFGLDGLTDAQKALKAYGPDAAAQKALNRAIVDTTLVPPSKVNAPKRSGALARSIRASSSPSYGFIIAGVRGGPVIYGSVIHFGWATRGLGGGGRLQGNQRQRQARLQMAASFDESRNPGQPRLGSSTIQKAGRYAGAHNKKKAVRGGPIRPQPFIYQAIDRRQQEVLDAYEWQLTARARLEQLL